MGIMGANGEQAEHPSLRNANAGFAGLAANGLPNRLSQGRRANRDDS
jgi:hypothetical protein